MRRRILLIDDEPDILANFRFIFEAENFEVETASSGNEAQRKIQQNPEFHLAICDLTMPDGDGASVLSRILLDYPHIPVMVVSAHFEGNKIIETLRLGASDYVVKPVDFASLVEKAYILSEIGVSPLRTRKNALLRLRNSSLSRKAKVA